MLSFVKDSIRQAFKNSGFNLVRIGPPPRKKLKALSITGWFWDDECPHLYLLAAMTSGRILEVGHFLGRSTACICEAIQDTRKPREFVSYDLGFRNDEEFKAYYDDLHKSNVDVPPYYRELVFSKNTTTTDVARQNLKALQLDQYVTLISGNAFELDKTKYDFIFCDAMHEPHEIVANLPRVVERSNHGCVWVFHDTNMQHAEIVLANADAEFVEIHDSLGVFLYTGE